MKKKKKGKKEHPKRRKRKEKKEKPKGKKGPPHFAAEGRGNQKGGKKIRSIAVPLCWGNKKSLGFLSP